MIMDMKMTDRQEELLKIREELIAAKDGLEEALLKMEIAAANEKESELAKKIAESAADSVSQKVFDNVDDMFADMGIKIPNE